MFKKRTLTVALVLIFAVGMLGMTTMADEYNDGEVKLSTGCCSQDEMEPLWAFTCCTFPDHIRHHSQRLLNFACFVFPDLVTPMRCRTCTALIYICSPRAPAWHLCFPRHVHVWHI